MIVSEEAAQEMLLGHRVPEEEAQHFKPTMDGPASMRNVRAAAEEEVDARPQPDEAEAQESECKHSAVAE